MAATPPVLEALVGRFDGSAFDAPPSRARLRLRVEEAGEWDFVIRRGSKRLEAVDRNERPDARLSAEVGAVLAERAALSHALTLEPASSELDIPVEYSDGDLRPSQCAPSESVTRTQESAGRSAKGTTA